MVFAPLSYLASLYLDDLGLQELGYVDEDGEEDDGRGQFEDAPVDGLRRRDDPVLVGVADGQEALEGDGQDQEDGDAQDDVGRRVQEVREHVGVEVEGQLEGADDAGKQGNIRKYAFKDSGQEIFRRLHKKELASSFSC